MYVRTACICVRLIRSGIAWYTHIYETIIVVCLLVCCYVAWNIMLVILCSYDTTTLFSVATTLCRIGQIDGDVIT